VARVSAADGRKAVRRTANFGGFVTDAAKGAREARISELSIDGCRLSPALDITVGAELWLKIGGHLPQRATVAWVEDGAAGCEFLTPISGLVVEELVEAARLAPRQGFAAA
jgi:hypothetical protein